jgi:hypothetical protein
MSTFGSVIRRVGQRGASQQAFVFLVGHKAVYYHFFVRLKVSLFFSFEVFDYFFLEVFVVGAGSVLFAGVVVDGFTFYAVDHWVVPFTSSNV